METFITTVVLGQIIFVVIEKLLGFHFKSFYFQSVKGCKVRDHKLRVRTQTESELYRTLMTHRDLICVR